MAAPRPQRSPATLGDVLYAASEAPVPEQDWVAFVRSIAAGDQLALHALYERAHRIVFTVILRIAADRHAAEELTLDVFHDVWRDAPRYDAADGTVLIWIANRARARAVDRQRLAGRTDTVDVRDQREPLHTALSALTPNERQSIEMTFFAGLTHAEAAARLNEPLGIVKARIRSGLHKLRRRLPRAIRADVRAVSSNRCDQSEVICAYVLQAIPPRDVAATEAHIASCPECRRELESLRPVVDWFVAWPTDVLRPAASLQARLASRIAEETGKMSVPPPARQWAEPEWKQVAPGIECKLLAADVEKHRVSMLVRLAPDASYPAHTHAGAEELHLLDGELWIDQRKLFPGDYNYGAPGAGDERVWSETGCTCLLVTSTKDVLH